MVVEVSIAMSLAVIPFSLAGDYERSGGTLVITYKTTRRHNTEHYKNPTTRSRLRTLIFN